MRRSDADWFRSNGSRSPRLHVNPNLLTNPGFEQATGEGTPTGWQWDPAKHGRDVPDGHDDSAPGPALRPAHKRDRVRAHVYGTLWSTAPVTLHPGRRYILSAWVKSAAPGNVTLIGGAAWQYRALAFPTGDTMAADCGELHPPGEGPRVHRAHQHGESDRGRLGRRYQARRRPRADSRSAGCGRLRRGFCSRPTLYRAWPKGTDRSGSRSRPGHRATWPPRPRSI